MSYSRCSFGMYFIYYARGKEFLQWTWNFHCLVDQHASFLGLYYLHALSTCAYDMLVVVFNTLWRIILKFICLVRFVSGYRLMPKPHYRMYFYHLFDFSIWLMHTNMLWVLYPSSLSIAWLMRVYPRYSRVREWLCWWHRIRTNRWYAWSWAAYAITVCHKARWTTSTNRPHLKGAYAWGYHRYAFSSTERVQTWTWI